MSNARATVALKDVSNITIGDGTGNAGGRKLHVLGTPRERAAAALEDLSNTTTKNDTSNVGGGGKVHISATIMKPSPPNDQPADTLVIDIDEDDGDNPLWAADYVKQMYEYYRSVELPISNYIPEQMEVTAYHRAILVDWLIDVQKKSSSSSIAVNIEIETLYLMVNVIDRFLGKKLVPLNELQLVGLGALLVGTKYEETFHFSIPELVDLCAHAFREEEILNVETEMLETLDYRLTVPSSCTFLIRFLKAASKDMSHSIKTVTMLAKYILDTTLISFHINRKYLPSELAAMSVFLARKCMTTGSMKRSWPGSVWSETLWYHTGYSEGKLRQISVDFLEERKTIDDWGLKALKKKYKKAASFDELLLHISISLKR